MIHFNTPEGSKERQAQEPLTLEQEEQVIYYLNELIKEAGFSPKGEKLLQQFVNHYQNLCHFKATHSE